MLTFFIRRPRFAMVIALLLTFVGAVSLKLIPVEQYPAITPPVVNVTASWPGASASDVAEAIAAPLETQLNGVDHMLYMESTSSDEGTYRLSITFAAGTDADLGDRRAKPGVAGAGSAPGGGAAEWGPRTQARQQPADGGEPLLAAGHAVAAVCQ